MWQRLVTDACEELGVAVISFMFDFISPTALRENAVAIRRGCTWSGCLLHTTHKPDVINRALHM